MMDVQKKKAYFASDAAVLTALRNAIAHYLGIAAGDVTVVVARTHQVDRFLVDYNVFISRYASSKSEQGVVAELSALSTGGLTTLIEAEFQAEGVDPRYDAVVAGVTDPVPQRFTTSTST